jgi:hypothetical protein
MKGGVYRMLTPLDILVFYILFHVLVFLRGNQITTEKRSDIFRFKVLVSESILSSVTFA